MRWVMGLFTVVGCIEDVWDGVSLLSQVLKVVIRVDLVLVLQLTVLEVPGELTVLTVIILVFLALLLLFGILSLVDDWLGGNGFGVWGKVVSEHICQLNGHVRVVGIWLVVICRVSQLRHNKVHIESLILIMVWVHHLFLHEGHLLWHGPVMLHLWVRVPTIEWVWSAVGWVWKWLLVCHGRCHWHARVEVLVCALQDVLG